MDVEKFLNKNYTDNGEWYDFKEGMRVKLKMPTNKETRRMLQESTTTFVNGRAPISDASKFNRLHNHTVIVDWEGFDGNDDQPIQCTNENKDLLMDNWIEFFRFVDNIVNPQEEKKPLISFGAEVKN